MNELELIARVTRDLPTNPAVVAGPGDDCALLDVGIPGQLLVFKTDSVVQGAHYLPDADPRRVGRKALGRVLSDFAAAAAWPTAALISLAVPSGVETAWIDGLYAGLAEIAREWNVAIVGGETTTCPERAVVTISAVGLVARERVVRRSGAQAGDAIFVSGELGGSLEGRHFDFRPRLEEARWLTENFKPRAMIDLSDGLASDLRHILKASGVGAEILSDSVPISHAARARARRGNGAKPPLVAALTDGEDFELLFTVASRDAVSVLDGWKARFPETRLTCVGKIVAEQGLRLRERRGIHEFTGHGYVHLA
jgi:thiamine-monophosphate kinase